MDPNVIYWENFCGEETEYDAFWSYALSVNTSNPDLTNCFQNTALLWIPSVFLLLGSFFYICYFHSYVPDEYYGSITKLGLCKLIGACLLIILSLVDLFYAVAIETTSATESIYPVDYVAPAIEVIIYATALGVQIWSTRKGIYSCAILFMFWLLKLLADIVTFRSLIMQYSGSINLTFVTFYISFALVLFEFILTFIPDHAANVIPWAAPKGERTPLLSQNGHLEAPAKVEEGRPCPKIGATFLSVLFFHWFTPTILQGYRRTLTWGDIWRIRREDSSYDIVPKFEREWQKELDKCHQAKKMAKSQKANGPVSGQEGTEGETDKAPKASLIMALVRTFGGYYMTAGVMLLCYNLTAFVNPQLLQIIISYVESEDGYQWQGIMYACAMFVASVSVVLFIHHSFNISYTTGMRIRTALSTAIYRKSLRLSPTAKKFSTVGEIVNLMSVDTQKLQDIPQMLHFVWSAPVVIALALYFLWQIVGWACMVGLAFMVMLLPVNSLFMASLIRKNQKAQMKIKDERLKLMNQVLSGIKVLKLYAWETHFENKLKALRDEELKYLRRNQILGAFTFMMFFCCPFIVAVLIFTTYVLSYPTNILDAQTAFVSISLINLMNLPLGIMPIAIMYGVMALVSIKRIGEFLQCEEIDENNVENDFSIDAAISIENGTFSWGEKDRITLQDIKMRVPRGKLVAVVGQVGSGKSSLISCMLGEMKKHLGRVNVLGSIAYVPQQAWIQNLTLRDNILFAKPLDEARYQDILTACALKQDLDILPGGDMTEIGERGINLSGGQKQRVSVARAVYQDADIYLLDDPLSAVDAHVGKHIFNNIIGPEGMLQHKTRVFVTNQVQHLKHVDEILVIKDGRISEQGTYEDLLEKDGAFAEFIRTYLKGQESESDEDAREERLRLERQVSGVGGDTERRSDSLLSHSSHSSQLRKRRSTYRSETKSKAKSHKTEKQEQKNLIIEEAVEEGSIKLSVLRYYVAAAGAVFGFLAFLAFAVFISAQVMTNIWLSVWSGDVPVNGTSDRDLLNLRLGVYGGLGAAQTAGVFGLALSICLGAITASRHLHNQLLSNILRCPMAFFDTTPLGRIVNRFSKDVDICDANIPQFTQSFITALAPLLATFIVIIYSFPLFTVVFVPLLIFFCIMQRVYVACARQLKRLDSVKRSPLYAFFHETLNGVSSVRAYSQQQRFTAHSDLLLDNNQRVWFEVFSSNRWVGIYAEIIGDLVVLFTALFAVLSKGSVDPGLVGLTLSYAMSVSGNMIMTMRSSCELETYIVAVERIMEYTETETEAPYEIKENKPPRSWPDSGEVEFIDYSTRYRPELELVLKGVTCKINPEEKVGIVGRTGAGKSSMTLSLFRLIEASGGSIVIDGIDIKNLGLHDLRGKLTIIPQDPVLFSGPLRFNLDPSEFYSDAEIWEALQHAHLKDFIVEKLPQQLEYECGEEGENLSVGQRQLLCLARALLRKTKILVLDEATASVDMETDDLIQETIRSEFKECTVITIAHRLNTIMDYDKVVVMADGKIIEYDAPDTLISDTSSAFYSMARDAGLC